MQSKTPVFALMSLLLIGVMPATASAQGGGKLLVEAVIETFDLDGRQVFLDPTLELPGNFQPGTQGSAMHPDQTLERVRERFQAEIARFDELLECADASALDSCRLPRNGIYFHFTLPEPIRGNVLPVRLIVVHEGRGEGGAILQEGWNLRVRKQPDGSWAVMDRELVGSESGLS